MASRSKKPSSTSAVASPVTFDLPEELLARLERSRVAAGLRTTSEIVRAAIDSFDFESCTPQPEGARRQISVRLSTEQRTTLKRTATRKDVSIGELLRLAIEAMPEPKAGARARVAPKSAVSPKKKAGVAPKKKVVANAAKSRARR